MAQPLVPQSQRWKYQQDATAPEDVADALFLGNFIQLPDAFFSFTGKSAPGR
jgi:hypothetical protein